MVIQFIDCIGIYPVGNLVEMTNGEVGVVIEKNSSQKTKPRILLLLNAQKQPQPNKILDLATGSSDSSGQAYRIHKVLRQDDYGIDLKKFHQENGFNLALGII